ncbi:EF-hand calcium-binding domain-containing protein 7-like [Symsagittifera roscoffensis]|uniref:EF-hand calcium-binding domain-containing protein 7-like n=1 Tax=Symsagittifera roscoffensis TaxID=84072 RepID=UPI00307B2286
MSSYKRERRSSQSSVRSLDSTASALGTKSSAESAFYEECRTTYMSMFKSTNERINSKQQLYTLLNRSGRCPSKRSMSKYWPSDTEYLIYTHFCKIMREEARQDYRNTLISLFHSFDPNNSGSLSRETLESILTSTGEPFSPAELDELFRLFQHTRRPDDSYDYTKISSKINETCSETARAHNIVQPSISNRPNSARKRVNEKIVEKMRAKNEPKDLAVWDQIPQFGFLRYEEKELVSTSFTLSLSSSSAVYLSAEPRNVIHVPKKDLDILLVCIKLDSSGNFTQSAYISDLYDGQTFSLKVDLPPGSYSVIPFTMGSRFLRRKTQPKTCNFIQKDDDSSPGELSEECKEAIETLFELVDVDGDGAISRSELDMFQMCCTGEKFSSEDWQVVSEMWETVDDCITQSGFKDMNKMEAKEDEEGLWNSFTKMGFNHALQLDHCCPIKLNLHAEKGDVMTVKVQAKNISFKQIESLLFDLTQKSSDKAAKGVIRTKTIEDVHVTTFKQGQMGFISVQNSGKSSRQVRLDLSKSSNVNLGSEFKDIVIGAQSKKVVQLLVPPDPSKEIVVKMAAEIRS